MRLDSAVQKVKDWFGPNSPFFHGDEARQQEPEQEQGYQAPQGFAPQYAPQYTQPQAQAYAQPQYAQPQPQPQPQYAPPQQPTYSQPQYAQPQPQAPQQAPAWGQQTVQEPYVPPRNRRPEQPRREDNLVQFPGQPQQPLQPEAPARVVATRIINLRGIDDCRNVITCLRDGDCVIAVMDSIADQGEIRRYVYTLTGACFSLASTITRLSGRFGAYLLTPEGVPVLVDHATAQMNQQARAPMRQRAYVQPPQEQGYAQPQPQGYAYAQQPQQQPMPTFYAQQPPQPQQAEFAQQQPDYGYVPDADTMYAEGQA